MFNKLIANAETATDVQFIDIGTEEVNQVINYVKILIGDLMPLLQLLFGVLIAITIVTIIVKIIR